MRKFVRVFVSAVVFAAGVNTAMAQVPATAVAPVAAAGAGAYVGKKLIGTCLATPFALCGDRCGRRRVCPQGGEKRRQAGCGNTGMRRRICVALPRSRARRTGRNKSDPALYDRPRWNVEEGVLLQPGKCAVDCSLQPALCEFCHQDVFIVTSKVCAATLARGENLRIPTALRLRLTRPRLSSSTWTHPGPAGS